MTMMMMMMIRPKRVKDLSFLNSSSSPLINFKNLRSMSSSSSSSSSPSNSSKFSTTRTSTSKLSNFDNDELSIKDLCSSSVTISKQLKKKLINDNSNNDTEDYKSTTTGRDKSEDILRISYLDDLLKVFDRTCRSKGLKPSTWLIFSTATLVSLNRPNSFDHFWRSVSNQVLSKGEEDRSKVIELIKESSLKSISFLGIPRSINSLNKFNEILKKDEEEGFHKVEKDDKKKDGTSTEKEFKFKGRRSYMNDFNESSKEVYDRGLKLWESIYDPLSSKLIKKLSNSYPDLPDHIILSHYGHLLSDPIENPSILGRVGTSLLAIGALRSSGQGLEPQLISHVFGLKKAFKLPISNRLYEMDESEIENLKLELEDLKRVSVESLGGGVHWLLEDEGIDWLIDSIDQLVRIVNLKESFKSKL